MSYNADETPFYEIASNFALKKFLEGIKPHVVEDICTWVENTIDLSFDKTSAANGKVKLYPYQKEALRATDDPTVQEVTLMWTQRLSKSFCWKASLLKHVHDGNCSSLILYPSAQMGERMNQDTVLPLLQTLPDAARDLSMRLNKTKDSYHIPSQGSVIYFAGSGTQIISYTANFCILDESDFIDLQNADDEQRNMAQIKALRIRMQSFKERKLIVCSSPTQYGGIVYQNWLRGSRGEWNMRCLNCQSLYPTKQLAYYVDGSKWAGLQWEKDENGTIIEDSIRWICPNCGHEHTYADAWQMNEQGIYVHQRPSNALHRSFQVGALANPSLWTWREIAQAQEDATNGDGKKFLCNSILSVPYKHVAEGDASVSVEEANRRRQVEYPLDLAEKLCVVCAGVDQQKSEISDTKYFCSAVHGWDEQGNCYLLSAGTDNSLADVEKRINATYFGHKVALCLIDQGGFSTVDDLDPFVASHANCMYYKGTNAKSIDNKDFVLSKNQHKLFLCNALGYQVKLLDLLYSPSKPTGYKWYFPLTVDSEYLKQVNNVQPNTRMGKDENGWEYANWASFGNSRRDFFDSSKMALCAMEIACSILPAGAFRHGRKPVFYVKEQLQRLARQKKIGRA